MEVRRRHHGGGARHEVAHEASWDHESEEVKYHSLGELEAASPAAAAAASSSLWSYLSWLYDMLPSWTAFSWLLRYGPTEEALDVSEAMQDRLDRFKTRIGEAWTDDEPEHVELLQRFWRLSFRNHGFVRKDPMWTSVGFQGPDPGTDFRGAGVNGLRHLEYFARRFPTEYGACVKSGYPFAVAGLNVTMMLYQLLGWGFKKVTVANATKRVLLNYLFSDDGVQREHRLEKLYCRAVLMLDAEWRRMNATYMQFPVVLAKTQDLFVARLPETVRELMATGEGAGRAAVAAAPDLIKFD